MTEWVSAPTARKSTPSRRRRGRSPAPGRRRTRGRCGASRAGGRPRRCRRRVKLSSSTSSAPSGEHLVELVERVDLDLARQVRRVARGRRSSAAPTDPAAATWLSLISTASPRPSRWLTPPPQRTAYFSSSRRPGRVLRVSRMRAPVPSTASTQAGSRSRRRRGGREVERGPLGGEQAADGRADGQRGRRPRPSRSPSGAGGEDRVAVDAEHGVAAPRGRPGNPASTPRARAVKPADRHGVGGHGRRGGGVGAVAQVLGERGADDAQQVVRVGDADLRGAADPGRRPASSSPHHRRIADARAHAAHRRRLAATTGRPSPSSRTCRLARCQVSSRSGWSVRTWQPRLSVRVPAAASTRGGEQGQRRVLDAGAVHAAPRAGRRLHGVRRGRRARRRPGRSPPRRSSPAAPTRRSATANTGSGSPRPTGDRARRGAGPRPPRGPPAPRRRGPRAASSTRAGWPRAGRCAPPRPRRRGRGPRCARRRR